MGSKKWVVLLTNLFGAAGGIPAFNRELVRALREIAKERGWTLKIYVLNDRLPSPAAAPRPLPSERGEGWGEGCEYHAFGGNRRRFVGESLKAAWKADHVLFGHIHFAPLALMIPRSRRWLVAHGIEVWGRLSWPRRLGLGRMDRILCVSGFTRDRLIERHHVKIEKVVLFPNTARFVASGKNAPAEPLDLGSLHVIFTISRLWPEERYKKIDRVIEAMPSVLKAVPDALYVVAGEGGDRTRLERLARDLGVGKRVVFTGALPDERVKSYYEACDVFILPSLGEGFGIVFLEAMACGKPCVGADAGAIPEVIQNGRTGLLVKPDSSEAVAEALIGLLKDETLRQSMGRAGKERFDSEYSSDRFKARLARITETAV